MPIDPVTADYSLIIPETPPKAAHSGTEKRYNHFPQTPISSYKKESSSKTKSPNPILFLPILSETLRSFPSNGIPQNLSQAGAWQILRPTFSQMKRKASPSTNSSTKEATCSPHPASYKSSPAKVQKRC